MTETVPPRTVNWIRLLLGLLSKLFGAVLVLWGAATLGFLAVKLIPGDPVDVMLGPLSSVTDEGRQVLRESMGLHLPLWDQYLLHLGNMVTGNFGTSFQLRKPVLEVLAAQAMPTLWLALAAMGASLLFATGFALLTRFGFMRAVSNLVELFAISAPVFWIAMILALVFNYQLGWLPILFGPEYLKIILPATALALSITATLAQLLREGLDRAAQEPFAFTALTRGASETRLVLRHTMRHSMAASTTLTGYIFGSLLGGTVLVETVFSRPGLGRVTLDAIATRDMPVVIAVIVFSAVVFIILNWIVDVVAAWLDPRLRRVEAVSVE